MQQEKIHFPRMPLAVYRELAAHLRQIEGVLARSLPQQSHQFDYLQSQVEGICLEYPDGMGEIQRQRLEEILDYYGRKYPNWQREPL